MKPDTAEQILRARARALAQPRDRSSTQQEIEVLEFRLAQERYALETRYVQEVQPLRELAVLPGTPEFLRGIVNIRGRIVPVFDLKKFFDVPQTGVTDLHRVILVQAADMQVGLLADMAAVVRKIAVASIQPPLPTLTGIRAEYLIGITHERLIVIDLLRIVGDPKVVVNDDSSS